MLFKILFRNQKANIIFGGGILLSISSCCPITPCDPVHSNKNINNNTNLCKTIKSNEDNNNVNNNDNNDNKYKFNTIIIGGGTAGCTTAYILSKWMEDNNIAGKVLLIDRGVHFESDKGPNTKMNSWYENWCEFGESHESIRSFDNSEYPVSPSDHKGLGGCGTHDTVSKKLL